MRVQKAPSGIEASQTLHEAFQYFLSDSTKRALLVDISAPPESLVPGASVPTKSSNATLKDDLVDVQSYLADDKAQYLILRDQATRSQTQATCIAVTFVPDSAPVRQKMLFASTRLTLVRDLGIEHFASTLFVTSKDELSEEGWAKHEAHGSMSAPLTEEEKSLQSIREAEAKESTGTGTRKGGHVSSGVNLPVDDIALQALRDLASSENGLVQLEIETASESVRLVQGAPVDSVSPDLLGKTLSDTSPRYTFYRYTSASTSTEALLFIYTCPPGASIKERMLYASCRSSILSTTAQSAGLTITNKLEAGSPDEVTGQVIMEEIEPNQDGSHGKATSKGFTRPKRPGRR
ncbi:MAG: Twinfilin-1 [Chrysothrix sp. TS-e1954]|nr:MAG: Twinfilin-1 [Chrysothrix sp. TS-e1954]